MSINKIYLPKLEVLESYLIENGEEAFYNRYIRNRDMIAGPTESHEFVHMVETEYTNRLNGKVN